MATEETWNYGTRERLYVDLSANGDVIDVDSVDFGFIPDGTGDSTDVATWHAAGGIEGDNTAAPAAWVLIGPTGDSSAAVELAKGTWRVYPRVTTATERPIPWPPIILKLT